MASPALFKRSMRTGDFNAIPARMRTLLLKKVRLLAYAQQRGPRRRQPGGEGDSTAIQYPLVIPGLDPGIHFVPLQRDAPMD